MIYIRTSRDDDKTGKLEEVGGVLALPMNNLPSGRNRWKHISKKKKKKKKEKRAPLAGFQQTASLLLPPVTRNRGRL